jgi:hypothetical protein
MRCVHCGSRLQVNLLGLRVIYRYLIGLALLLGCICGTLVMSREFVAAVVLASAALFFFIVAATLMGIMIFNCAEISAPGSTRQQETSAS